MSRKSVVIPNTDKLPNSEVYTKELEKFESHALGIEDFSNTYKLGITWESLGLKFPDYCNEKWYIEISKLGHAFLRIENEMSIVYLPSDISLNQYEWFDEKRNELEKELVNMSFKVVDRYGNVLLSESSRYTPESDEYLLKMLYLIISEQYKNSNKPKTRL